MKGDIEIYSYTNFRKLLEDYYVQEKKKAPDKVSYRFLAKRAGFSSPNFLHLVIKGKKNLGHESIHRMARVMGLNKRESLFFESLVLFNQCTDPQEKSLAFEKVISFREYRNAKKLVLDQYDYFSKWYYPVIREMVNLDNFQEDPLWVSRTINPQITVAEASEALSKLESLGLIKRSAAGRLCQTDSNLTTEEEVASTALAKFHEMMIRHGLESLKKTADEREISGLTMSLSAEQFHQVRQKIREFHREIQKLIADNGQDSPKQICQLNFQLFHLIQTKRRAAYENKSTV